MIDIKIKCIICLNNKFLYEFKNNKNACKKCINKLSEFKKKIHSTISGSLLYNINSYIYDYLPYTIQELKQHLEAQFEPWMTWLNCGVYNKKIWNDQDQITWRWQIDHIIPQSKFIFNSIRDESFLKCWSLSNLKPLSSKNNILKNKKYYETWEIYCKRIEKYLIVGKENL